MRKQTSSHRLSWYEYGLIAFAFAVGTPLGVALLLLPHNRDARPRIVGVLIIAALMATFPPAYEAERRTKSGRRWQALPPPHSTAFRQLLARHLFLCAGHAVAVGVLLGLHFALSLDLRLVFAAVGLLTGGLLLAGFGIKRRLQAVWARSGAQSAQ